MTSNVSGKTKIGASEDLATWRTKSLKSLEWREFVCGWGAAFVNIVVTYPIHKLIFRQMLHGVQIGSAYEQLRHEGMLYLYRGVFPPLAQKTISLSVMFGVYDGTRRPLVDHFGLNPYLAKVVAGIVSGTFEAVLMPFERIQTLLADAKYHKHFKNTAEAFQFIWTNHGIRELYRGLVPILWRNGPSNALFFVLREEANDRLPQRTNMTARTAQEFTAGALIGASVSFLFYPANVIKVSMQSQYGHPSQSMKTAFLQVYNERGRLLRNFYRGAWFNSSRAFLSWGIMNTAYEHIKELIY